MVEEKDGCVYTSSTVGILEKGVLVIREFDSKMKRGNEEVI